MNASCEVPMVLGVVIGIDYLAFCCWLDNAGRGSAGGYFAGGLTFLDWMLGGR